ncbi:MAG: hypothetical protein AB7K09_17270 [Planctomycetota bacterium]
MKTIALSGTGKGCGKTTVGTFIAGQLHDVAAFKVTPKHKTSLGAAEFELPVSGDDLSSSTSSTSSGASASSMVVDDPEVLLTRGTDTRRYWDAGAEPVRWVRARDEGVLEVIGDLSAETAASVAPSLLIVESTRYVARGGASDVALMIYPNGETTVSNAAMDALAHCDAIVVTKWRPGPLQLSLFDDPRFPQEKLDLPVFAFNVDNDNLALDDRYRMQEWLAEKLDLQQVPHTSDTAVRV